MRTATLRSSEGMKPGASSPRTTGQSTPRPGGARTWLVRTSSLRPSRARVLSGPSRGAEAPRSIPARVQRAHRRADLCRIVRASTLGTLRKCRLRARGAASCHVALTPAWSAFRARQHIATGGSPWYEGEFSDKPSQGAARRDAGSLRAAPCGGSISRLPPSHGLPPVATDYPPPAGAKAAPSAILVCSLRLTLHAWAPSGPNCLRPRTAA